MHRTECEEIAHCNICARLTGDFFCSIVSVMKLPLIQKPFRYRYFDAATMLVVVNAALYFLSDFIWPSLNDSLALIPMEIKADGHWWTVVTYMFAPG